MRASICHRAMLNGACVAALVAASPVVAQTSAATPAPDVAVTAAAQPAGPAATDRAAQPGPKQPDPNQPDPNQIVITGVRGSLLRSIEAKHNSATIVDTISAEELGKFPDRNVAEALGNIPGITVGRDGRGEGKSISIRGLGDDFAITTLNGRILPTDGGTRAFAFDILPSEMIAGAEVRKAVQAASLEGSIGGSVDLRSARPFDSKGFHLSGSVEGQYNDLSRKGGYKASGVVSTTFADDRMGVLVSATYSSTKLRTDNLGEYSPAQDTELAQHTDFNGNGVIDNDGKQYIWPLFYSNGVVLGSRKRLGLSGAYQWKPSNRFKLTIDGLYSHFNEQEHNYRQSNFLSPRDDPNAFDPANPLIGLKWLPGSSRADANGVVTNFIDGNYTAEVLTTDEPRKTNTYQVGGHIDWNPSERLVVALDAYTGQAKRNDGGKNRFVVAGITDSIGVFATRDGALPDLATTIPGGRPLSAATNNDYRAHYIGIQGDNVKDRINSAKLDAVWKTEAGLFHSLDLGAAWTDRRKVDIVIDNQATACNFCGYPFTFGSIGAAVIRPFPVGNLLSGQPGNFPRDFASFDIDTYLAALPRAENNPAVLNPNDCTNPGDPTTCQPYPTGYATQIIAPDLPLSFDIHEKTYAAYAQVNLKGDHWFGDVGVRLVHTKVASLGASITIKSIVKRPGNQADFDVQFNDPTAVTGGGAYTKWLPSANFAYDFTDQLRLRLAASKAIARPTFAQLSPASDYSAAQSGTFIIFDAGNPNLKPTTASQLDASLEYYGGKHLSLSLAVFYKKIKDFATTHPIDVTITPTNQPAGVPPTYDFTRITVANGDSASVLGVEVGGQYFLDNGFGLQANATFNRSRATSGTLTTKLPGAIPFSANLKLFYEKHGVNAQISYNYASRYTQAQEGLIAGLPIIEDPYHEVSASLGYDLTKHFHVYVEGANLLNSSIKRFYTYRNVPAFYEISGRAFFAGVRARF